MKQVEAEASLSTHLPPFLRYPLVPPKGHTSFILIPHGWSNLRNLPILYAEVEDRHQLWGAYFKTFFHSTYPSLEKH